MPLLENGNVDVEPNHKKRTHRGWKAMPFVMGNESFERLASVGSTANFMVFLLTQFHMEQVMASNVINIWSGVLNFAPLIGAYVSDAHLGRFKTIAFAIIFPFMGMVMLTIIAWVPELRPPPCKLQCTAPTKSQLSVLAIALGFLAVGTGGIRPCSIPFGVDQFDASTEEGRRGINSFFNWYYMSLNIVMIIAFTLIAYIQVSISWVLGFAIPAALMLLAMAFFFIGTNFYVYVVPEGSVFTSILHVLSAAYNKRNEAEGDNPLYFDPPLNLKGTQVTKLPLTTKLR